MYEPESPRLIVVKSRMSADSWGARVEAARKSEETFLLIASKVNGGTSLNEGILQEVPASRRSWVYRHWKKFREQGFEALIDARRPREAKLSRACGGLIEAARLANPKLTAEAALEILRDQKVGALPSVETIYKYFRRVDERRRYKERTKEKKAKKKVVELPLAGGELLLAAEAETRMMGALTDAVVGLAEKAKDRDFGQDRIELYYQSNLDYC